MFVGYNTKSRKEYHGLNEEQVVKLVTDVFQSVAERDIYTGLKNIIKARLSHIFVL